MSDGEILGRPAQLRASLRAHALAAVALRDHDARRHRPRREPLEPLPPRARRPPAHADARRLRPPGDAALPREAVSEIVLVRHGETEWSRSGQHTGVTDLPLLPEGEEQALHGRAEARRARVRARPQLADAARAPHRRAGRLRRPRRGRRGPARAQLRHLRGPHHQGDPRRAPGLGRVARRHARAARRSTQLAARADRVIERALAADGDTLVFAHSHLLRELGARWIGLAPDGGGKLVLGTAAVCVLGFERERRVLRAGTCDRVDVQLAGRRRSTTRCSSSPCAPAASAPAA